MSRMHPGRISPGVGLGVRAYLRQMGLMPTSPISALRESVLSVRGLLDSEEVTLESRAHRLDGVHLDFPPQERPRPGARRSRRSLRTARPGRHGSSRQRDARPVDKRVGRGWRSGRVRKGATQPLTGGSRLGGPVAVSHRTGRGGRPFNGPPGPSQTRSQGTRITGGAIQRRLSMIGGQRKEVMTLMARTKYDHAWPHPGVPSWV
jgi:hypothetical protein